MTVRIRRATAEDAFGIAAVHVQSWQAAYRHIFPADYLAALSVMDREARWRVALTRNDEAVFVAEESGAVVGFAAAATSRDDDAVAGCIGELHTLYVHPDLWGTGTGTELHDTALDVLASRGYREATLWVLERNRRARRFYERRGWLPDGARTQEERGGIAVVEIRYRRGVEGVDRSGGSR